MSNPKSPFRKFPAMVIADQGAYASIELDRCGLLDVSHAPIATKFRSAAE